MLSGTHSTLLHTKLTKTRLAAAGLTGLVLQGSNGEAAHLTHQERSLTVRTVRHALDDAGYPHLPLIVGTGAPSVRETVLLCKQVICSSDVADMQAHNDGGNFVIVLPPCYYMTLMTEDALLDFFWSVSFSPQALADRRLLTAPLSQSLSTTFRALLKALTSHLTNC